MLLREILEDRSIPDVGTKAARINVTEVNVDRHVVPEELEQFERISQSGRPAFGDRPFPVIYGYSLEFGNNTASAMDALKMRGQYTVEQMESTIRAAVKQYVTLLSRVDYSKKETALPGMSLGKRNAVARVQRMLKSKDTIVVVMPSSSPLPSIIAEELAKIYPTLRVLPITALRKQHPHLSHTLLRQKGKDPSKATDWRRVERELNELRDELQMEIETRPSNTPSPQELALQAAVKKKEQQLERLGSFQRKQMMRNAASEYGRAYYGWVTPDENEASLLTATQVIIVDDNVVGGDTFAQVVKEMVKLRQAPVDMAGLVLHKFG